MANTTYQSGRYLVTDQELADWRVFPPDDTTIVAVAGECPTCHHETRQEVQSRVLVQMARGVVVQNPELPPSERMTRVCECACEQAHPDPKDPTKTWPTCGRWWLVAIRLDPDGPGQRVLAARDDSLLGAAQLAQKAAAEQETKLRSSAEKWIGAITALIGLFGLSGVLTGANALSSLPLAPRLVAGLAAAVAFIAGGKAIVLSYRAAYGWPVEVDLSTDEKLRDWYDARRARLVTAAAEFKNGVYFAATSAVALAVAVGFIWFWPASTPALPLVTVTRVDKTTVCGTPLASGLGQQLWIRQANGDVQTVDGTQVLSIQAATQCPS